MTVTATSEDYDQIDWDVAPSPDHTPIRGAGIKIDRVGLAALREMKSNPCVLPEEREAIHERLEARNEFRLAQSQASQDQTNLEEKNIVQVRANFGHNPPGWNGPVNSCEGASARITLAALAFLGAGVCACFPWTIAASPILVGYGIHCIQGDVEERGLQLITEMKN